MQVALSWCYDSHHNNILHNDTGHKVLICDTQPFMLCRVLLIIVVNVMLSVVGPCSIAGVTRDSLVLKTSPIYVSHNGALG